MTHRYSIFLFVLLAGCVGDPDLHGSDSSIQFQFEELERSRWETATAGCEGVDIRELTLFACEGQPLLGALVRSDGNVVCVDAMSVLIDELQMVTDPLASDPSPQPSHPGLGGMGDIETREYRGHTGTSNTTAGGTYGDPTPTPVVRADPTPTPVTNPVLRGPIQVPIAQPEPDEEDPTPTPTMEMEQ